ncbi:hypothetical protein B0I37DRAFT_229196 [Chaetomium sp. MPI-CAGE-AT-0009]|nr:hypothetical protein B0I37DRAFT_229196 [Chaetomium sp. MPI-CAGE-AT-0009]
MLAPSPSITKQTGVETELQTKRCLRLFAEDGPRPKVPTGPLAFPKGRLMGFCHVDGKSGISSFAGLVPAIQTKYQQPVEPNPPGSMRIRCESRRRILENEGKDALLEQGLETQRGKPKMDTRKRLHRPIKGAAFQKTPDPPAIDARVWGQGTFISQEVHGSLSGFARLRMGRQAKRYGAKNVFSWGFLSQGLSSASPRRRILFGTGIIIVAASFV